MLYLPRYKKGELNMKSTTSKIDILKYVLSILLFLFTLVTFYIFTHWHNYITKYLEKINKLY